MERGARGHHCYPQSEAEREYGQFRFFYLFTSHSRVFSGSYPNLWTMVFSGQWDCTVGSTILEPGFPVKFVAPRGDPSKSFTENRSICGVRSDRNKGSQKSFRFPIRWIWSLCKTSINSSSSINPFMGSPSIFWHELVKVKPQFEAWTRQWRSSQSKMDPCCLPGWAVSGIARCVSVSLYGLKLGE